LPKVNEADFPFWSIVAFVVPRLALYWKGFATYCALSATCWWACGIVVQQHSFVPSYYKVSIPTK